jgi:AcrR family transcriptional regulator
MGMRERILCAAMEGFLRQGYHRTSTLDIATRARVSKRDLYAQFGSKQGILAAAIQERARRMQVALTLPRPRSRPELLGVLAMFGATQLQEVSRPEVLALYRLAVAEADRSPDLARTLDEGGRGATSAAMTALLAGAQADGLVGAGDPAVMAATFGALLWRALLVPLLLGVAEPPPPEAMRQRGAEAAEALLRLHPP